MSEPSIKSLSTSDLNWHGDTPASPLYDDFYFFNEDGYGETRHVFLDGININQIDHDSSKPYIIVETGFGTGLNFLATWKAWRDAKIKAPLYFISIEGHPLHEDVLTRSHAQFPILAEQSSTLIKHIPPPSPGHHLRHFDNGHITLLLIYDDILSGLKSLMSTVDAWYLDGFTPSKNPEMWSVSVFDQIKRLSDQGTKLATFTAAGFVRRGLSNRGFAMQKRAGFQKKRECLCGIFEKTRDSTQSKNILHMNKINTAYSKTIVLGAGFAGAFTANALHRSGVDVTVINSPDKPTASNVPGAILSPTFIQNHQGASRILTSSFLHSFSNEHILNNLCKPLGLLQKANGEKDKKRLNTLPSFLNWPRSWLDRAEDGLEFPRCGSVDTKNILHELLVGINQQPATIVDIQFIENEWHLFNQTNHLVARAPNLVLCGGVSGSDLPYINQMHMVPNRGQIELILDSAIYPAGSVTFDGYICPTINFKGLKVRPVGSSFTRNINDDWLDHNKEDQQETIQNLQHNINTITSPEPMDSWVGLRATTIDHFPIVGPIPKWEQWKNSLRPLAKDSKRNKPLYPLEYHKGLYTLTGLGSKGLQLAPLCAEIINAMIVGIPSPIADEDIKILHPGRFLIRDIIKGL